MVTLILWEAHSSLFPSNPEERGKLIIIHAEKGKSNMDSGKTKMWGIRAEGGHGFSVTDGYGKEIFAITSDFTTPYIKFKVKPVLSIDEMIAVLKGMQQ